MTERPYLGGMLPAMTEEQIAEFREGFAAQNWHHPVVLPPRESVLMDSTCIVEVRHLPDGTDETNEVRIRVTAGVARPLPADLDRKILDLIRAEWPRELPDGWERTDG